MNKRNIDVIYDEAMHCGVFNLVWILVMAGTCFFAEEEISSNYYVFHPDRDTAQNDFKDFCELQAESEMSAL